MQDTVCASAYLILIPPYEGRAVIHTPFIDEQTEVREVKDLPQGLTARGKARGPADSECWGISLSV